MPLGGWLIYGEELRCKQQIHIHQRSSHASALTCKGLRDALSYPVIESITAPLSASNTKLYRKYGVSDLLPLQAQPSLLIFCGQKALA
ncbi:hypothetical protein Plhal304r1_c046g0127631 [Plasmopara halstedii]